MVSWFTLGVCGMISGAVSLLNRNKWFAVIFVLMGVPMLIKGMIDDNKRIADLIKGGKDGKK